MRWPSSRPAFRFEFFNRTVETVLFKPLTFDEITQIVDLLVADLNKRLAERRVTANLDAEAKDKVAEKGHDPVVGARPLKRFLRGEVETELARALIAGNIDPDSRIAFTV